MQTAIKGGGELFHSFGWIELTDEMIADTEQFIITCFSPKSKDCSFDDLLYEVYHDTTFSSTTENIKQHIRCACFQTFLWQHASFVDQITLTPQKYGYVDDEIGQLRVLIESATKFLVSGNVCPCRVK